MIPDYQQFVKDFREIMEREVWPTPTVGDCVRFLYQEIGEADSIAMKLGYQDKDYVRNNPLSGDKEWKAHEQLELELGQAFLMLCTYANLLDINLNRALKCAIHYQRAKAGRKLSLKDISAIWKLSLREDR